MTAPLLRLAGVGKTYRSGTAALAGLDLTLAQGSFVSLVGPSGCGKSTVLRLIAGLMRPDAGAILWGQERAARIGFVFQEPTLLPWARVRDNIRLPLRLARLRGPAVEQRIDEALEKVGLREAARAYPRELSGGMKMRVSIARALVTDPELLLMDEPFAALDEPTRFRLNDDLRDLWAERGLTCLFVTHSVYESVYLSSRVVVMSPRPGRVIADVPIDLPDQRSADLRTRPAYGEQCRLVSAALG